MGSYQLFICFHFLMKPKVGTVFKVLNFSLPQNTRQQNEGRKFVSLDIMFYIFVKTQDDLNRILFFRNGNA